MESGVNKNVLNLTKFSHSLFSEINSTMSPASLEDLKYNGVEDIIYQKDAVMDALEFSMPNSTESNEIPAFVSNDSTVPSSRTNYTTQGNLNQNLDIDMSILMHPFCILH